MATSNVDYYQRQKELQDQVSRSEQERIHLERQLKLLMQSDQNSSQLKSAKLHAYWKKVCADEKRAQERNAMLVREFERIDSHLSSLASRTQRLSFLKKQYADYVARTYPEWTRTIEHNMLGVGDTQQKNTSASAPGVLDPTGVRRSQDWAEAEREDANSQHQSHPQQHHHQHHHQQQQQQQLSQDAPQQQWMARQSHDGGRPGATAVPSQPSLSAQHRPQTQPTSSAASVGSKRDSFSNASAKKSSGTPLSAAPSVPAVGQKQQQPQHYPQHPAQQSSQQVAAPVKAASAVNSGRDESSRSEYVNISQFSNNKQATHAGQGDQHSMTPANDDMSDFGSGSDLPLSAGDASPVKATGPKGSLPQQDDANRSRANSVRSLRSTGSLLPELTVDGMIRLLTYIEDNLDSRKQDTEYYGSPILDPDEKVDLIQRANAGGSLHQLSGTKASHLVLEQMSHVVRNLPEECLISDALLTRPIAQITATTVGASLTGDAQNLWLAVYAHFNRLHDANVMEAKEIAAVFTPCVVADRSQRQDKAFSLLVSLLEGDDATDASSIASGRQPGSPHRAGSSLMEDGRVPPLKFGSLVDKPFSDDESSFFDQSMPKEPAVPLNETSAYKQMLSGTLSRTPQKPVVTSDDTDDDVEKEFANVLSPKSAQPPAPITPSMSAQQQQPQSASEPDSPSEVSSPGPKTPVYVPTAVEQKSIFGSTGSSQGQRRTAGLKLGSDFETDSEIEPVIFGSSKAAPSAEDKDDFDFYD